MKSYRKWTPRETDKLICLVEQGLSYPTIAKHLKRTPGAIQVRAKRIGVRITTTNATMSAKTVTKVLGLCCSKSVTRWIRLGWLRATNAGTGRVLWRVTWDALTAFLENPRYWVAWSPARIPDAALREWAYEVRGVSGRLLSQAEVARRYWVQPKTVAKWIDLGLLPSVRNGNRHVPESALNDFVPPCQRPRRANPRPC